jgi:hypothetical protein
MEYAPSVSYCFVPLRFRDTFSHMSTPSTSLNRWETAPKPSIATSVPPPSFTRLRRSSPVPSTTPPPLLSLSAAAPSWSSGSTITTTTTTSTTTSAPPLPPPPHVHDSKWLNRQPSLSLPMLPTSSYATPTATATATPTRMPKTNKSPQRHVTGLFCSYSTRGDCNFGGRCDLIHVPPEQLRRIDHPESFWFPYFSRVRPPPASCRSATSAAANTTTPPVPPMPQRQGTLALILQTAMADVCPALHTCTGCSMLHTVSDAQDLLLCREFNTRGSCSLGNHCTSIHDSRVLDRLVWQRMSMPERSLTTLGSASSSVSAMNVTPSSSSITLLSPTSASTFPRFPFVSIPSSTLGTLSASVAPIWDTFQSKPSKPSKPSDHKATTTMSTWDDACRFQPSPIARSSFASLDHWQYEKITVSDQFDGKRLGPPTPTHIQWSDK